MSQLIKTGSSGGGGGGTVTSISQGTGITLTPNPITGVGTVALTIPVTIADGGTNATSMSNTDGVVYFDGTRLVTTAVGTATNVLTSNGAGVAPTFQAAPTTGRLFLISTQNASTSANIPFTSIGSYNAYLLVGNNITTSAAATLTAQVSINNGSTWISTGYNAGVNTTPYNSATVTNANISTALLLTSSINNALAGTANGYWYFFSMNESVTAYPVVNGLFNIVVNTPSVTGGQSFGAYSTISNANAINIIAASGTIVTGEFSLYGISQ